MDRQGNRLGYGPRGILYYVAVMRCPTEKAHGIQIFKTLESLAKYFDSSYLICGKRRQTNSELLDKDPQKYYGCDNNFDIKYIWYFDIVRLYGRIPNMAWKILYLIASLLFTVRVAIFFIGKSADLPVLYTREWIPACLLALLGYRVGLEVHQVNTSEFSSRAAAIVTAVVNRFPNFELVVISKSMSKYFNAMGVPLDRVQVIHDAADPPSAISTLNRRDADLPQTFLNADFKVVYTGHLHAGKGVDVMIEAASLLPSVPFFIVGGEPEGVKKHIQMCKRKGISNIEFLGHVSPTLVRTYQSLASVLVLPQTSEAYQSPLKLFEYLSSGRPFICSNIGVLLEVVTDNVHARVFEAGDHEGLASLVEQARDDISVFEKTVPNALQLASSYSWGVRARQIREVLMWAPSK